MGLKCHLSRRLKDISTPDFSTMNFSTPWLKNSWLKSPGLKSSWLKSLGLNGLGLKLGVEKSRVEISFNLDTILAIRSASSLGIAKTESTGPMRQLTSGVWRTLEVFKLSYRTIHKFLKVLSVTVKSRVVDWSTIQLWTFRSQPIRIKFPFHK